MDAFNVLPLPIAALVRQARNSHDPTRRHLAAYYAWEASVRLAVAAAPPSDATALGMPSVGDWVSAAPKREVKLVHASILELAGFLTETVTGKPSQPKSIFPKQLLPLLAPYRNRVVGHGSTRGDDFNERAAKLFLDAIVPAWEAGAFFPPEARFVYVDRVEVHDASGLRAHGLDLAGVASQRESPASVPSSDGPILPRRLYLRSGGRYRVLYPWLLYDEREDGRERVLFFNALRKGKGEYLDYATGAVIEARALTAFATLADDLATRFDAERTVGEAEPESPAADIVLEKASRDDASRPRRWAPFALAGAGALAAGAIALYLVRDRGPSAPVAASTATEVTTTASPSASSQEAVIESSELDVPVLASVPPDVQRDFRRAVEDMLALNLSSAETALRDIVARAPEEPWPHMVLSWTYAIKERFEAARAESDAAQRLAKSATEGRDAELLKLLDAIEGPDRQAQIEVAARFRASHPRYAFGHSILAYYLTNSGTLEEQLARFDTAIAIGGRHVLSQYAKAYALLHADRAAEAEKVLDSALALRPTSSWLLYERGLVAMALGDMAGAKRHLLRSLEGDPPFIAQIVYAQVLLDSGSAEDEAARARHVQSVLESTKNEDDRLAMMCAHGMALLRRGRAKSGDELLDAATKAARLDKPGTVVRCLQVATWLDDAIRRPERAEARLGALQKAIASAQRMPTKDDDAARYLNTELQGVVAVSRGDLSTAEDAITQLTKMKRPTSEVALRLALAKKEKPKPPDPATTGYFPKRVRQLWLRARILDEEGDDERAAAAYRSLADLAAPCFKSERWADFSCAGFIVDGLVRHAELERRRKDDAAARDRIARFNELWPNADPDLALVKAAAKISKPAK